MTPERIAEIVARAKQDATAQRAGWPVRSCPFSSVAEASLWSKEFQQALKDWKK